MTITLEERAALLSQPVFSEAFEGMLEAIAGVLGDNFDKPEKDEMCQILFGASKSYVVMRNRVAEFKKRAGIPGHVRLAKKISAYISRYVLQNEPLLPDYLAYLGKISNGTAGTMMYADFKAAHQK